MKKEEFIWILQRGQFPYAVFDDFDRACKWIEESKASGLMTGYPINQTALSWALDKGFFKAKKEEHDTIAYEETFTSASMPHYHFEDGKLV